MINVTRRSSAYAAFFLALAAPLLFYAIGYFALCGESVPVTIGSQYGEVRTYPTTWLAAAYRPVAQLEEALTGQRIVTQCREESGWSGE